VDDCSTTKAAALRVSTWASAFAWPLLVVMGHNTANAASRASHDQGKTGRLSWPKTGILVVDPAAAAHLSSMCTDARPLCSVCWKLTKRNLQQQQHKAVMGRCLLLVMLVRKELPQQLERKTRAGTSGDDG
jgi:hypothetical protein